MQDDVSRLVGIEGLVVTGVEDVGACLLLGVELVAGAGCCRWCERASLEVKERPVVRVREPADRGPSGVFVVAQAPLRV